jgi:hypothetical protein
MKPSIIIIAILAFYSLTANAQDDPWLKFTIKTGVCHGATPADITVIAKKSTLKSFMRKESVHFDNCSYILESPDEIIEGATSVDPPPGGGDDKKIYVEDPGDFVELYKREKEANKVTSEVCVNSDGEVSFTIGTDDAKIGISSKGKITVSAKSKDGITHSAEF